MRGIKTFVVSAAICIASMLFSCPAFAAWSLISHATASSDTSATTSAINTTGATILIAVVMRYNQAIGFTFADSKSNTWIELTPQGRTALGKVSIFYAVNPNVGTGHTFTGTASSNFFGSVSVQAWSGAITVSPFDVQNGANGAAVTTPYSPGSVLPSQNNSLIVCGYVSGTVQTTFSIDSGFTISDQTPGSTGFYFSSAAAYLVQNTAASVNPAWTNTFSADNWSTVIAVFKPSVSGSFIFKPFP
jgi:hypothetical protein